MSVLSYEWLRFPEIHFAQAQKALPDSGKQTSEGSLRLESKQNKTSQKDTEGVDIWTATATESCTKVIAK